MTPRERVSAAVAAKSSPSPIKVVNLEIDSRACKRRCSCRLRIRRGEGERRWMPTGREDWLCEKPRETTHLRAVPYPEGAELAFSWAARGGRNGKNETTGSHGGG